MLEFLIVFAVSVLMLMGVHAADIECVRPPARRRGRKIRLPLLPARTRGQRASSLNAEAH